MEGTLSKAKTYMQSSDYSRAIILLQRARNLCKCKSVFREKHAAKEHSSAKVCLRNTLLSAALDEEDGAAVYKAATNPCSCGVPKLSCDDEAHMDVLDKLAACSAAMGKSEAAVGFAAASIHLNPRSPVGYCRLSKLIRTRSLDKATLRSDVDDEIMALAVVRHGAFNVKTYGNVGHPLYKILQALSRKLYRKDPLGVFPPEIKVMILSHLDTLELVRCQRVSKRWLFAIGDDPNIWEKLLFIFTGHKKYEPARLAKGMLKVISRSRRASTLSLAPAVFNVPQYQLVFSQLQNLRHLHLENDRGLPLLDKPCAKPPKHLTKLSFFVLQRSPVGAGEDSVWFRSILAASASTLEELQVLGQTAAVTRVYMPRLRVMRVRSDVQPPAYRRQTLFLDRLSVQTPNLEQICLEGRLSVRGQSDTYLWPNLKALVIPCANVLLEPEHRHHLIPPGIRVIDGTTNHNAWSMLVANHQQIPDSDGWASLQYLRCMNPVEPADLRRILAPSLANGNLKVLSLGTPVEELKDMEIESQHVQALGMRVGSQYNPFYQGPCCLSWVSKFRNAHTFTVEGDYEPISALAELVLRPGTKRIFEPSLYEDQRDQLLEAARERDVEVITGDFPVIFPWTFDDDERDGGDWGSGRHSGRGEVDVVEQWRNARGRWTYTHFSDLGRVSRQPFFRE